jgi:hypothetical protein
MIERHSSVQTIRTERQMPKVDAHQQRWGLSIGRCVWLMRPAEPPMSGVICFMVLRHNLIVCSALDLPAS